MVTKRSYTFAILKHGLYKSVVWVETTDLRMRNINNIRNFKSTTQTRKYSKLPHSSRCVRRFDHMLYDLLLVLTMADEENHIDKHKFKTPFVCGARNLGEALRRISEGAAMIRTKVCRNF